MPWEGAAQDGGALPARDLCLSNAKCPQDPPPPRQPNPSFPNLLMRALSMAWVAQALQPQTRVPILTTACYNTSLERRDTTRDTGLGARMVP